MPQFPRLAAWLQQLQAERRAQGERTPVLDLILPGADPRPAGPQPRPPAPIPNVGRPAGQPPPAASAGQPRGNPDVLALQQRLQAAGFDPGPIDGIMGPRTQAAMQAMQRAQMAQQPPMARPGGSVPMPLPRPNPERMAAPASPMASYAPMMRPGSGGAPMAQPATAPPQSPARMNFRVPVAAGPLPQAPGIALPGMVGTAALPPLPPQTPARPDIAAMTLNQLQDFIRNGDPTGPELRQASARIEELRQAAMQMGQPGQPAPPAAPPAEPMPATILDAFRRARVTGAGFDDLLRSWGMMPQRQPGTGLSPQVMDAMRRRSAVPMV